MANPLREIPPPPGFAPRRSVATSDPSVAAPFKVFGVPMTAPPSPVTVPPPGFRRTHDGSSSSTAPPADAASDPEVIVLSDDDDDKRVKRSYFTGRNSSVPKIKYGPYKCQRCKKVFLVNQEFAAHWRSHYKTETFAERRRRRTARLRKLVFRLGTARDGRITVDSFRRRETPVMNRSHRGGDAFDVNRPSGRRPVPIVPRPRPIIINETSAGGSRNYGAGAAAAPAPAGFRIVDRRGTCRPIITTVLPPRPLVINDAGAGGSGSRSEGRNVLPTGRIERRPRKIEGLPGRPKMVKEEDKRPEPEGKKRVGVAGAGRLLIKVLKDREEILEALRPSKKDKDEVKDEEATDSDDDMRPFKRAKPPTKSDIRVREMALRLRLARANLIGKGKAPAVASCSSNGSN